MPRRRGTIAQPNMYDFAEQKYQEGVDMSRQANAEQVQREEYMEKMYQQDMDFIMNEEQEQMDADLANELADIALDDNLTTTQKLEKSTVAKITRAKDSQDPLGLIQSALGDLEKGKADLSTAETNLQKFKADLRKTRAEAADKEAAARKKDAEVDIARKKSESPNQQWTAEQKNIDAEAKARNMTRGEVYEERANKKKGKIKITEDDFVDSRSRVKKIVGEYGRTTMTDGDIEDLANQHSKITAQLQEEYDMSEYEAKREADKIVMDDLTEVVEDKTWGGVGEMRARKFSVKTPDGKEYKFKSQKQADEFKRKAGL